MKLLLLILLVGCEFDQPGKHYLPTDRAATQCDYILDWEARRVCQGTSVIDGQPDAGVGDAGADR